MAFCPNCGAENADSALRCSNCGQPLKAGAKVSSSDDTGNVGWGVLGFCFPIVGLILYLVWMNDKPNNARVAGIGALIGFGLGIISAIAQFALLG